jgi:monofunctional biosynthetic peptidoglycan transglycosylase
MIARAIRRLFKWLGWLVFAWTAVTVIAVALLRWVDPPTSAFMIASRIDSLRTGEARPLRQQWVDYRLIAPSAPLAVIAAEDQKFVWHAGFDFESIDDSIRNHRRGKRLRGASTISQQVAKNLFLWNDPSFVRKGLEAYFTVLIEALWPKQRIIEVYLNVAQFGQGVYGVGAASQQYFRKRAARLNPSEAALLAAVLPNPVRMRVNAPSRYVMARQQWVLRQMQDLGGTSYLAAVRNR